MANHWVDVDGNRFYPWSPENALHNTSCGVYCFAKSSFSLVGAYSPLYWGIAGHFGDRFSRHPQWAPAFNLGMDTVLIHYESDEGRRIALERHLIKRYPTALNEQHNTPWDRAGALANALASDPAFLPFSRVPETRRALTNALMSPHIPVASNTAATSRALARALDAGALYDEAWKSVR